MMLQRLTLLGVVALACAAALAVAQPPPQPYSQWTQVNSNAWTPRASALSAYFPGAAGANGKWLIFGGFTKTNTSLWQSLSDAYTSMDLGVTWQPAGSNLLPFARAEMASDVVPLTGGGYKLIATGGIDFNTWRQFNDVWQSTDSGATFTQVTTAAQWSKRAAHAVVTQTVNNVVSLYLLSGYQESTTAFTPLNDVWFSNDLGNSWIIRGIAPFPPRGDAGVVVTPAGNILVVGGFGTDASGTGSYTYSYRNDVWMSDVDVMNWTQMTAAAAWKHRLGAIVEYFGNSLVVIGGDSGWRDDKNNDVWISWDNGSSFTWVTNATFDGRSDAVAEVIGQNLVIAGGEDNGHLTRHISSEIWSSVISYTPPIEPPTPVPEPEKEKVPFSEWNLVQKNPWTPRASAVSAYFPAEGPQVPGRWLIVGGYTRHDHGSLQVVTDSYTSEDEGVTWTPITYPTPFIQIEMAADLVTNSDGSAVLVISGGIDFVSYTSYNNIFKSVDRGQSFQLVTLNAAWPVRHGHGMVTVSLGQFGEKLVVIGGYSLHGSNVLTVLNDIWISSDMGVSWSSAGQAPFAGRGDAGIVVNDRDQVFVLGGFGGYADMPQVALNDVWMAEGSNLNGADGWKQMSAAAAWQPRWGAVVESFNNTLVVISGDVTDSITGQELKSNHVWLSWDNGAEWTRVTNLTFAGRSDAVAEVIDERLYIAGGETYGQNMQSIAMSEIWSTWIQYNTDVEPPTPNVNPPDGTPSHKGLSTGGLVGIVFAVLIVLGVVAFLCFRQYTKSRAPRGTAPQDSDYRLQV